MARDPRKRSKALRSSRFASLRFAPNIGKRRTSLSDRQTPALHLLATAPDPIANAPGKLSSSRNRNSSQPIGSDPETSLFVPFGLLFTLFDFPIFGATFGESSPKNGKHLTRRSR